MLSKTRSTIIALVASGGLAVAAAPASAAVVIVKEKGGWGHYNCDIGNGVYIKDGSTWTENGKTYTCKNGTISTARTSIGGGLPIYTAPLTNAQPGSPSPTAVTTTSSTPLLVS
jgi:hypothetical protein